MKRPDRSLKSLLPNLAVKLETTPFALYERQRALVRAGLLHAVPGRGAGSGVRVTPHAIAMLLVSLVATQSLVEAEKETKIVASLKSRTGACPITGKKTFGAAVTAIAAYGGAQMIRVERSGPRRQARIIKRTEPDGFVFSDFGASDDKIRGILTTIIVLRLPRGLYEEETK
jgi:hypothetical protein